MKKPDGDPLKLTRAVINRHGLRNWLDEYPWLTGYLGNPKAAVWFVAENPSLRGIQEVDARADAMSPNLQWTCRPGTSSRLLRDALTAAGLKAGDPCVDGGWRCYLTNADKEPQEVRARNKGKKRDFMVQQANRWLPVLQAEVDRGAPRVLVALGRQAQTLLSYMRNAASEKGERKGQENSLRLKGAHPDTNEIGTAGAEIFAG